MYERSIVELILNSVKNIYFQTQLCGIFHNPCTHICTFLCLQNSKTARITDAAIL